jgi:4,5-DOPA dioxygenase extradiol
VLIIGSGNMVHNLGLIAWDKMNMDNYGYDWAIEASTKMKNLILNGDHKSLVKYDLLGNAFKYAIPTPEHYLPLLYTLALKNENEKITIFNDKAMAGSLTMTSIKIESI